MKRVLFVCLGNICRSPMAESLFLHKIRKSGLNDEFIVESAGTGNWHIGHDPDHRTIRVLSQNGIDEFSEARQFCSADFESFDHIIAMDDQNVSDLSRWIGARSEKVSLMMSWVDAPPTLHVPDPYQGTFADFELVFELLDEATSELLKKLQRNSDSSVN